MLSFSKLKAVMFISSSLISISFLLASFSMLMQGQPSNVAVVCLLSSMLAAGFAIILAMALRKETKTMKAVVTVDSGIPILLESADIDHTNVNDWNQRLKRQKLSNRDLTAHIIHYYEQRKALDLLSEDAQLQIQFKEVEIVIPDEKKSKKTDANKDTDDVQVP